MLMYVTSDKRQWFTIWADLETVLVVRAKEPSHRTFASLDGRDRFGNSPTVYVRTPEQARRVIACMESLIEALEGQPEPEQAVPA